jgi:hypothetical protein
LRRALAREPGVWLAGSHDVNTRLSRQWHRHVDVEYDGHGTESPQLFARQVIAPEDHNVESTYETGS